MNGEDQIEPPEKTTFQKLMETFTFVQCKGLVVKRKLSP